MRILHVAHQQLRKYGHTRVNWAQKLYYGLIKNDHNVCSFSDRDVAAFEAPLGIRDLGKNKSNKRLIETAIAFQPDLMIVGHCDIIKNETLETIRKLLPNLVISSCNNDPLFVPVNAEKIHHRCNVVDNMFVSSGISELQIFAHKRAKLFHMPNPVDPAIESAKNHLKTDFIHDLLFCSKSEAHTERGNTVKYLKDNLNKTIRFNTPGSFGQAGVWGLDYDKTLAQSKMGLNLNRQEHVDWYSSARMAQMAGNGLLLFTHRSANFDRLLPQESIVYFDTAEELAQRITHFQHNDEQRQHWAKNSYEFFHREINNKLYAQYIVEASLGLPFSHDYVWHESL